MPPYLVGQASTLRGSDEEVCIIDFGSGMYPNSQCLPLLTSKKAFFLDTPPDQLQAALATRAPEDFFRLPIGAKTDMWSAGCAVSTMFWLFDLLLDSSRHSRSNYLSFNFSFLR